jgi:hypothetical protein
METVMRFALLSLVAGCAGMFGMLPPHPVVKVQNVGNADVCKVERQADGYDKEPMLDAHSGDQTMSGPINAGAIKEFEFPRPVKDAPPLMYTLRFWTCEGAPLTDKRVAAGKDSIVAIP